MKMKNLKVNKELIEKKPTYLNGLRFARNIAAVRTIINSTLLAGGIYCDYKLYARPLTLTNFLLFTACSGIGLYGFTEFIFSYDDWAKYNGDITLIKKAKNIETKSDKFEKVLSKVLDDLSID